MRAAVNNPGIHSEERGSCRAAAFGSAGASPSRNLAHPRAMNHGHPITLAIAEPNATAILLLVLGVLMAVSVLFSRGADRLGVPLMLMFILLGMLGGSEALGKIWFDDYALAVRF